VIVGKYGHTVVERNRLRRRIRELARIRLIPFCNSLDLIVRALPGAYGAEFGQLGDEVDSVKRELLTITPEG
jgi:ribonuclease P protein component